MGFLYGHRTKDSRSPREPIERPEPLEGRETAQHIGHRNHVRANGGIEPSRELSPLEGALIGAKDLNPCGFVPLPEGGRVCAASVQEEANRIKCAPLVIARGGSVQAQAGIIQGTKETLKRCPLWSGSRVASAPAHVPVQRDESGKLVG